MESRLDFIIKFFIGIISIVSFIIFLVEMNNLNDRNYDENVHIHHNIHVNFTQVSVDNRPIKTINHTKHDHFEDLLGYLHETRTSKRSEPFEQVIIRVFKPKIRVPTIGSLLDIKPSPNDTGLKRLQLGINYNELYAESDPLVTEVLNDIATLPIVRFEEMEGGTQLKLIAHFSNGMNALFKPVRFPLEKQQNPNHVHFSYFENARAEIAAYHVDRALGFRRAMPTIGRKINMITELYEIGPEPLRNTFYKSPANNTCFHGNCGFYCDLHHAACGNGNYLEASFSSFLPVREDGWKVDRAEISSPWRREFGKTVHQWEIVPDYCEGVKTKPPYDYGTHLLDVMDMAIFDFLIDNRDRHHYEVFENFGRSSFIIHVDHGRAFGQALIDDYSLLTPLRQCCQIHESTMKTLLKFHNGPKRLSTIVRESMANDPIAPVLWEPHLEALDRRIEIVLQQIRTCIANSRTFY